MTRTNPIVLDLTPERVRVIDAESTRTKDAVVTRIAGVLAERYRRPDPTEWVSRIRWREAFSTTGIGRHFALVLDFQHPNEVVETTNAEADLWLFQLPAGVDWDALDEQSVHIIACPVFHHGGGAENYLAVLSAIQKAWANVTAEGNIALAAMSVGDAADRINALTAGQVGS